jgi:hypothetical protein
LFGRYTKPSKIRESNINALSPQKNAIIKTKGKDHVTAPLGKDRAAHRHWIAGLFALYFSSGALDR